MNTSGCCFGSQASGPLESSFASKRTPSLVAKGVVQLSPWASAAEPASPSDRSATQKALEASGRGGKRRNGVLMAYLLRVYWNRLQHGPPSRLHRISLAKLANGSFCQIVGENRVLIAGRFRQQLDTAFGFRSNTRVPGHPRMRRRSFGPGSRQGAHDFAVGIEGEPGEGEVHSAFRHRRQALSFERAGRGFAEDVPRGSG